MKFFRSILVAAALLFASSIGEVDAQSQALKSFAYVSSGCTTSPATLLVFDGAGHWKMGSGTDMAAPGAGSFPSGNFFVREVSLKVLSGSASTWVIIGHSGANGDWITGASTIGDPAQSIVFPSDAAPLFMAGASPLEYFDVHTSSCDGSISVAVKISTVPAP